MRKRTILFLEFFLVFSGIATGDAPLADEADSREPAPIHRILFLRATSTGASSVEELCAKKEYRARVGARFVRLDWRFEKPTPVARLELESCDGAFHDGVEAYIDFDRRKLFVEGGKTILTIATGGTPLTSISVNFRQSASSCVKRARFIGPGDQDLDVRCPIVMAADVVMVPVAPGSMPTRGTATAVTSTSAPSASSVSALASKRSPSPVSLFGGREWRSGSPLHLFDSRPETFWSAPLKDAAFSISFESAQEIHGLRVWNGDGANELAFRMEGRAESLMIKGDDGFSETHPLTDQASVQEFRFQKPMRSKHLVVRVTGTADGRVALSEMRLLGPSGPITIPVEKGRLEIESNHLSEFSKSGLDEVLDRELVSVDSETDGDENGGWIFRFRADGGFYIRGLSDDERTSRTFYANGFFGLISSTKDSLKLRASGVRRTSVLAPDAEACEAACGAVDTAQGTMFTELIELERSAKGTIMVRNRTPKRAKVLPFRDLRVRRLSQHE